MVILGLLVGYVAPKYFGQLSKSEVGTAEAQLDALATALDIYRLDLGRYPSSEEGLQVLVTPNEQNVKWRGPYLDNSIPMDPWGQAYQYVMPGQQAEYDLFSYGKDRQVGGTGDNADIYLQK
jgi:general secretion pathway protein G